MCSNMNVKWLWQLMMLITHIEMCVGDWIRYTEAKTNRSASQSVRNYTQFGRNSLKYHWLTLYTWWWCVGIYSGLSVYLWNFAVLTVTRCFFLSSALALYLYMVIINNNFFLSNWILLITCNAIRNLIWYFDVECMHLIEHFQSI